MSKAILINPYEKTFSEIEIDSFDNAKEKIGAWIADIVHFDTHTGNVILIDDNGLYEQPKLENGNVAGIKIEEKILAGKLLVIGKEKAKGKSYVYEDVDVEHFQKTLNKGFRWIQIDSDAMMVYPN